MNISILIPSRNGVEYLEWAYNSIRKNQGDHYVEILVLDDISDKDNTWEWCSDIVEIDPLFKPFQNGTGERYGISGGYKFLSQYATQEIICHWHNDMFMTEGTLDVIEQQLYCFMEDVEINSGPPENIPYIVRNRKSPFNKNVVCLTRIEPPIYNDPGLYPEKIIWDDAPIEMKDWDEQRFLNYLPTAKKLWNTKTTEGHFAPFFMFREEYLRLGGNDTLNFPKQAREDSDFGFRLVLDGFKTIQIPQFVFHFASRGNRRSKHETDVFTDNPEWEKINVISTRNFIRKWGTLNLHDEYLNPTIPHKYKIGFKVKNCTPELLYHLEPWCDNITTDLKLQQIAEYIRKEQPNTTFDLVSRMDGGMLTDSGFDPDIEVKIDGMKLDQQDWINLQYLSEILTDSGEIGTMQVGNLLIEIKALTHYENELIVCKKP